MIPILPLRLTYTLPAPFRLTTYPGSLWRSALGATLRRNVCITGADTCTGCPFLSRCAYGYLFETPRPATETELTRQYRDMPRPYILSPVSPVGNYQAGDTLAVDITLIGPGHHFLPEILSAASQLRLGNERLRLGSPEYHLLPPASNTIQPQPASPADLLSARPAQPHPPVAPDKVRLSFMHPLRLRRRNHYLRPDDFDFATFFTTLMRRINMLRVFSKDHTPPHDPRELSDQARTVTWQPIQLHWSDYKRRSARQGKQIPMGGITGCIELTDGFVDLWPWLWAGQWLHVGKGAVMGNGRYTIEYSAYP